jgi:hypothetical protein
MLWIAPALHVLASAISGFYYVRYLFVLARQQTLPDSTLSQMVYWLFNLPCLAIVNLLSGSMPLSWQPQEYTRVWMTQPVTLMICTVVNTGVWIWLGAQWEDPGERVSWWRWALAGLGAALALGVLFHTRKLDYQVIPFVVWPLLLAGWAARPAFNGTKRPDPPGVSLPGDPG